MLQLRRPRQPTTRLTPARAASERSFGVIKSRFRCLDNSGGTLLYTPERACRIVTAVSVLHNFAILKNLDVTLDDAVVARNAAVQPAAIPPHQQNASGAEFRRRVIQQHF